MKYEIYRHDSTGSAWFICSVKTKEEAEAKIAEFKKCTRGVYFSWIKKKDVENFIEDHFAVTGVNI